MNKKAFEVSGVSLSWFDETQFDPTIPHTNKTNLEFISVNFGAIFI